MKQNFRFGLFVVGALLLLGGSASWWYATHPPLTAPEQIAANILRHLAPNFTWNGSSKKELDSLLRGAMFQWRNVQFQRTGERIVVNGAQATSTGSYRMRYRPGPDAPFETSSGNYTLHWQMLDGQWKIVKAEGGSSMQNAE